MFKRVLVLKLVVHGFCCTSSVAHGENDGGSTAHDVTACINGGDAALHLFVDGDGILAAQLQSFDGLRHNGVRRYAYGYYSHVDIECDSSTRDGHRTASSAGVGFAKVHLLEDDLLDGSLLVGDVFERIVQGQEFDAFFLGVFYFFQRAGISASLRR